jgi:hypothetical protein
MKGRGVRQSIRTHSDSLPNRQKALRAHVLYRKKRSKAQSNANANQFIFGKVIDNSFLAGY